MENKRIDYIDFAKGIWIFMVVWASAMHGTSALMNAFLVPLFFFVSGFIFRQKNMKQLFTDKMNRLLIPFAFFFILSWFFYLVPMMMHNDAGISNHLGLISNMLTGNEANGGNSAIALFMASFTVCMLYSMIVSCTKNIWMQTLMCLTLGICGTMIMKLNMTIPFKMDVACTVMIFFHLGRLARRFDMIPMISDRKRMITVPSLLIAACATWFITKMNMQMSGIQHADIMQNITGNYALFMIAALCAICGFMIISYKAGHQSTTIRYFGQHAWIILGTHMLLLGVAEGIAKNYTDISSFYYQFLVSVIVMGISMGTIYVCKNFIPAVTGYRNMLMTPRLSAE